MRNPLTQRQSVTSKKPNRPQATEPVVESYVGDNHPYRGTEAHGVKDTTEPLEDMDYSEGRPVMYDEPSEIDEPDPIPVVVVNRSGRERRKMRTIIGYAGGTDFGSARRVLGEDESRTNARIKNTQAQTVYLGSEPHLAKSGYGYPLAQNETYDTRTQEEVFASVDNATDVALPVIIEYSQGL